MYALLCLIFLISNLSLHCEELPLHSKLDTRMQRKIESVVVVKTESYDQNYDNFRGDGADYELELVIGGRGNSPGQFLLPIDLTLIDGEIYVVDFGNQRIQVFDKEGQYQRILNLPEVNQPVQIRIFNNYMYVVDKKSAAVYVYDKNHKLVRTLGNKGVRKGQLNSPGSVALDDRGLIWVSDENNNRIEVFTFDKMFSKKTEYFMNIGEYQPNIYLRSPKGLLWVDHKKQMFAIDSGTARILKFDKNGNYLGPVQDYTQDKSKVFMPQSIFVDSYNNLYVADHMSHRVLKYGVKGNALGEIGYSGQYSSVQSGEPTSDSELWKSLRKTPQTSYFWFEDSEMSFPQGIYVDKGGDVYVCDWGNNRVKKFSLSFFRKALNFYKDFEFKKAIENFKKCDPSNSKYQLVEFYLAMCHYYLGQLAASFEAKLEQFRLAFGYLQGLKLKSEIGKFRNDEIRDLSLYYLSRVRSYQ